MQVVVSSFELKYDRGVLCHAPEDGAAWNYEDMAIDDQELHWPPPELSTAHEVLNGEQLKTRALHIHPMGPRHQHVEGLRTV